MKWFVHGDKSAEAHNDENQSHRRYQIAYPYAVTTYMLASCNGNRIANVDTMDEGIRLCEWHERAMETPG